MDAGILRGEDKMTSIVEYVNAVEAYKELCSSQVPNTVSDLLSQYVKVFVVHPTAKGYDEAFDFLCMSDEGDDDDEEARREATRFSRGGGVNTALDIDEVDKIIRALAMDDDDSDDEDEDDLEDEAWRLLRGVAKEGPAPMHCAPRRGGPMALARGRPRCPLERKPDCDFVVKLMSVEEMVQSGLNVNSLHEEVDPAELVDFSGCKSWDDAIRVGRTTWSRARTHARRRVGGGHAKLVQRRRRTHGGQGTLAAAHHVLRRGTRGEARAGVQRGEEESRQERVRGRRRAGAQDAPGRQQRRQQRIRRREKNGDGESFAA